MGEIEGTYRRVDPAEAARGKPTPVRATRSDESAAETHGNLLPITVHLLDDTEKIFDVPPKAEGIALLTTVYKYLNLVESDYFGLELEPYPKCGFTVWLDSQKPIAKQVKKPKNVVFKLGVKFFPEDSSQLQEEITRYQFALQVRQDLLAGRLVASEMSSSLMAACLLQADVSDYEEQRSSQQLREVQYLPNQEVLANRILDYHRQFAGLSPAEADVQLLEIARRQDTYGLRLHQAYDKEGASINLAVGYSGVSVFQNTTKINTFNWAKIRKLSFKRKYFLVKFHPDIEGNYQDTLEFSMKGRDACKAFWKGCVESHAFFRLQDPPRPKPKSVLFSRGSSFRYSGRTQKQVSMYVRDHGSRRVQFERRSTKMRSSQSHRAIPAHPPQLTAEPPKQSASFSEGESGGHVWDPVSLILAKEGSLPPKQLETTSDQLPSPTGRVDQGPDVLVSRPRPPGDPQTEPWRADPQAVAASTSPLPSTGTGAATEPAAAARVEEEEEARKKRCPADKAYFIAKEICTTERTHIKDLEVITVWFSSFLGQESPMSRELSSKLFSSFQPLCDFHRTFLKEVETRLTLWEGKSNAHLKGDHGKIGDIMLKNMQLLKRLVWPLCGMEQVLRGLESEVQASQKLADACRTFELQRVCHLPLGGFLLRPLQRPLHYRLLLERLCKHHAPDHLDFRDCRAALAEVSEITYGLQDTLLHLENVQKLMELQRDLTDMEDLAMPGREFIREGCLHKLTRKGLQQRMFFLFNDMLVYTSKSLTTNNQFKVHGKMQLSTLKITASEREFSIPCSFTLSTPQKHVVVAANSPEEMDKWVEDVTLAARRAAAAAGDTVGHATAGRSPCRETDIADSHIYSSDDQEDSAEDEAASPRSPHGASSERLSVHQQTSSTVQVCCHRQTSVSLLDISRAAENQLSGYLLRKFKNNSGWQKLWVVFTNFCLFFYKTHQDNFPLASLPVLGYSITLPSESDGILKDYVFKLQFKSHIYFFRAESEYTFERWMEVIRSATSSSARTRLLSRKDSHFT
ncbi:FERM, ARHGEF and pleckstrin domain-containing protein 1-like isoform X1 [Petromyzon marinus]|uniref:FERM, ARHGEF and pleckstrin domain-containing protein 1-like isoform X1 n=1 Tax=Petromyzon marinus TaxID=7757 RepID=UPI003F6F7EE3